MVMKEDGCVVDSRETQRRNPKLCVCVVYVVVNLHGRHETIRKQGKLYVRTCASLHRLQCCACAQQAHA